MARVEFRWEDWEEFCVEHERPEGVRSFWEQMHDAWGGRRNDDLMRRLNDFLGGHGVEAIQQEGHYVDNYHHNIIAAYVNFGDTYVTTLLFDTENDTYYLTSWGDWLEAWEQEHPQEVACSSCGQMTTDFDADTGECPECRRQREEGSPPPTWNPAQYPRPLIAMLRSIEGAPIAVHFMERTASDPNVEDPMLAFSVPLLPESAQTRYEAVFIAKAPGDPYMRAWASLVDAFQRGQTDLYIASTNPPHMNVGIERDQFQRLAVAMDTFLERGMESQAKQFLETPPLLWTCRQVNEIHWIPDERGDGGGVQAFVRKNAVGSRLEFDDLVVWAATGEELQQLIEDGFIKWNRDDSVREYLQEIGVCRAK